ncbi:MAG: AAA family ATPase [Pirellulaceae bacterium]
MAKADGHLIDSARQALQYLQTELETHLYQLHVSDPTLERTEGDTPTVQQLLPTEEPRASTPPGSATKSIEPASREDMFAEAMKELDGLIGLESIKNEVKSLVNFLQLQRHRQEAGMPAMQITLHMVFDGNPGTGKTTVARIVGRLLGGMGIVSKGHVVEVDRSDLVAQYAGQTGPRTNKKIDEALDGILFIDEAYSLVARGEDAYGQEALQALLKRMEDDRHRLIVILAGYPGPMTQLLKANPGLSSRFNRRLLFADYEPSDLGRIFARLCALNHYQLKPEVRKKLLIGFDWLFQHRDEHFGNGRVVRNLFEDSIRHMANRICGVAPLTKELLTNLEEADIRFENVPVEAAARAEPRVRFQMRCPDCHQRCKFNADFITQQVKCPNCQAAFLVDWPEPVINWAEV